MKNPFEPFYDSCVWLAYVVLQMFYVEHLVVVSTVYSVNTSLGFKVQRKQINNQERIEFFRGQDTPARGNACTNK